MANEEQEVIIDSPETNEDTETTEDTQDEPAQEEEVVEEKPVKKERPQETPEAKRARLQRELKQHNKKFGFADPQPEKQRETESPVDDSNLSSKELYALIDAKVPEADIEEVTKAAKLLGKSVTEALKDDVVKSILARRAEERETANAAHTGSSRRTTSKVTDEILLSNASKGILPEPGSPDAERLFWAKRGGKR